MRRPGSLRGRVILQKVSSSRSRKRLFVTALAILIAFVLCIRITSSVRLRLFKHNKSETGIASFYGRDFHGKKTASGEIFNMRGYSAAHRTLPFGTLVRVTNVSNGKMLHLSLLANDRDGKGRGWAQWGGGIAEGKFPARYIPVLLHKTP